MLVLTQLDTTVFKRLVVLIALSYYWHRMKIWQTTRSAPGRSSMNARLVRLWCFVSTILPQKSLASSSIWSVLSRPPYVFCVPKCRHKRLKSSTTKKEFCFFSVSSCATEGKANRPRRGVYDRRINCSGWKILEMCKGSQYLAPSRSNLPQYFHWFQRRGSWSSFSWLLHRATLCEWLTQK